MKHSRPQSSDKLNTSYMQDAHIDIIQQTRKIIKELSQEERLQKAKKHLEDALAFRTPRPDIYHGSHTTFFKIIYKVQISSIWCYILYILAYAFMYLVLLDNRQNFSLIVSLQSSILLIFWIDVLAEIYHKSYQTLRINSKFQARFYFRVVVLFLLVIDEIIFGITFNGDRPIRIFRILRGLLPIFYDHFIRKAFHALFAAYRDIIVYLVFYVLVIISFALIANQIIELPQNSISDQYSNNYGEFGKAIFVIYVLSTYDAYPDNQHIALESSLGYYSIFIIFIFLNVLFFVVIPSSLIFRSFQQTRSKIVLIDQIKQQHSLILCFVSLGEDNLNISNKKIIKFLLYVYKQKLRYIDYIAQVCLKLDDNKNHQIQISQFMNLCKILQANSVMMPPMFYDNETWLEIKRWLDSKLKLRTIVQSRIFKIVTGILIVLTFINSILYMTTKLQAFAIIDNIMVVLFLFEVILKFLGLGPQNYFFHKWNFLDLLLIILCLSLDMIPRHLIPHNSDVLSKMARMFRITTLIKALIGKSDNSIYISIRRLTGQTAIILPIIIKFMPMLLITYYTYGIIGMEAFYGPTRITPQQSRYSFYNKFSNFNSFLSTQFIMVQISVEAGWSALAYDHAYRYGYYALVMLYFVSIHIATVLILSSLIKGLVWSVYSTIDSQFENRQKIEQAKTKKQAEIIEKIYQFQEVKRMIEQQQEFLPDTLVKKYIYQNKQDLEIMKKLRNINKREKEKDYKGRKVILQEVRKQHKRFSEFQLNNKPQINHQELNHELSANKSGLDLSIDSSIEDIQDSFELQEKMQEIISKTVLNSKIKFFYAIIYSRSFMQFLENKLIDPFQVISSQKFNIHRDIINNQQSVALLSYELNVLLHIEQSEKQQKNEILQGMVQDKILTEEQASKLVNRRKNKLGRNIDVNWVIKNTFLGQTNDALIKKFQVEYFSDIYGRSFKQINKVTIQPLLKYEATLTYCLRNLFRYPTINIIDFFTILTTLQDAFSNKLLKKGSLLKFVYQIDLESDTWFSIEVKHNRQLKIHFIKSGIWLYTKNQQSNKIMYGRDIFNWDLSSRKDHKECEELMRKFYQSFQSLAFCLDNQEIFLSSNPSFFIYDLFSFFIDVKNIRRKQNQALSISKIMLVVLSKQQQRESSNYLSYEFKPLLINNSKKQTSQMFKFDESENETIKKLKKFQVMDHQKIIETEGLPYAFLLNLMRDIKDILELYSSTLIKQIQNALNIQYAKVDLQGHNSKLSNHQSRSQKSQTIQQNKSKQSESNSQNNSQKSDIISHQHSSPDKQSSSRIISDEI